MECWDIDIYENYGMGGYDAWFSFDDEWWDVQYAWDGSYSGTAGEWWNFISFALVIYPPQFMHLSKNTFSYSHGTCLDPQSTRYRTRNGGTQPCQGSISGWKCSSSDIEGCPDGWTTGEEDGCPPEAATCCFDYDNGSCWDSLSQLLD